ncbi:hypothetical protein ACF08W_29325 [Streptomyces sp. NPDC015144]|uniref:hypothetical protein n=1 Tax=Streptomyces sp. NPDC015144 TaxID=3364944 RepID=UPI0036FD552D
MTTQPTIAPEQPMHDAHGHYSPPAGFEYPFSIGDIAFAVARLLPGDWFADSGNWGVTGKVFSPDGIVFELFVDYDNDLFMECRLPEGQKLPSGTAFTGDMRVAHDGVYLELASAADGLDYLSQQYAAAIRVIAGLSAPDAQ